MHEDIWLEIEKNMNVEISEADRELILSRANLEFIESDLRYLRIGGAIYSTNPSKFRIELLKKHVKNHYEENQC